MSKTTRLTLPNRAERAAIRAHLLLLDHRISGDGTCLADGPCPVGDWTQSDALIVSLIDELDDRTTRKQDKP